MAAINFDELRKELANPIAPEGVQRLVEFLEEESVVDEDEVVFVDEDHPVYGLARCGSDAEPGSQEWHLDGVSLPATQLVRFAREAINDVRKHITENGWTHVVHGRTAWRPEENLHGRYCRLASREVAMVLGANMDAYPWDGNLIPGSAPWVVEGDSNPQGIGFTCVLARGQTLPIGQSSFEYHFLDCHHPWYHKDVSVPLWTQRTVAQFRDAENDQENWLWYEGDVRHSPDVSVAEYVSVWQVREAEDGSLVWAMIWNSDDND